MDSKKTIILLLLPLACGLAASQAVWQDDAGNIVTSLNTGWGDLLFHIRAAIFFAEQGGLPHESFFLSGHPVGYAYAADIISSWLWQAGLSITHAFQLPTIVLAITITALIQWFAWRLTKSLPAALLSTLLFITFGSLGGWPAIKQIIFTSNSSWWTALRYLPQGVTTWHEAGFYIINPFVMMLHQRAYLVGFPVFLLLLYFTHQYWQKTSLDRLTPIVLTGLLLAFTHPMTWAATLLILTTWFFWLTLLKIKKINPRQDALFIISIIIITVGGYLIIKTLQPNASPSVIQWHPGWQATNLISWFILWLKNIGLYIALIPFSLFFLRHRQPILFALILAGLTPFIAANLFQFAPWIWDNTKIFTPAWLIMALGVGTTLTTLWRQNNNYLYRSFILTTIILLIFSGTLEIARVFTYRTNPDILINQPDLSLGQTIRQKTKPTDIILTSPQANHPVFILSGRPSLIAYEGWLWSQGWLGLYEQRVADTHLIYQGTNQSIGLLKKHNISYVTISSAELAAKANLPWFQQNFPLTISNSQYQIFDTTALANSP